MDLRQPRGLSYFTIFSWHSPPTGVQSWSLFSRPHALTPTMGCQAEHSRVLPVTCPGLTDGVTHWSLTGSRDGDKDTFLSFSDGVSQAGTACSTPAACFGCWVLGPGIERTTAASSIAVVSAEVEMTAYALLTYTLLGDMATALPVVKWLSQQRNALGGFSSTQASWAGPEGGARV